jgi:exodeoxyribonuclease VIII
MSDAETGAETPPEPGIYKDVPEAVYRSWERFGFVNQTWLKIFQRSPRHAQYARTQPSVASAAMELGTGVHIAVLEPERFEREYVEGIEGDGRRKEVKIARAELAEKHPGKTILAGGDYQRAVGMRDACWSDPLVSSLLKGPGQNEVAVVWDDEEIGIRCMARIDRIAADVARPDGSGSDTWLFDLKTAKDASPEGFRKAVGNYDYHFQAAFYNDGLAAAAPRFRRFGFIVVESAAPFVPAVYELCEADMEQGRDEYRAALRQCKEARMSGNWAGYTGAEIKPTELPRWRQRGRDEL